MELDIQVNACSGEGGLLSYAYLLTAVTLCEQDFV